jgi:hypothetical protein
MNGKEQGNDVKPSRRWAVITLLLLALGTGVGVGVARVSGAANGAASLLPNAISFWNSSDGLLASGRAVRGTCCRDDAVAATSDGGRTYHVVLRTEGPVGWIATAGDAEAWAVVDRCTADDTCARS